MTIVETAETSQTRVDKRHCTAHRTRVLSQLVRYTNEYNYSTVFHIEHATLLHPFTVITSTKSSRTKRDEQTQRRLISQINLMLDK